METAHTYTANEVKPLRGPGVKKAIRPNANLTLVAGTLLVPETGASQNDVQTLTITGTPTGGTFTLSFNGYTTAAIAYNATAAAVQAALELLPNIGSGNVTCTGGALPGTGVTITFGGLLANEPQPVITTTDSLTGGSSPASAIAHTTTGRTKGKFKLYASDNGNPVILQRDITTDEKGRIYYGTTNKASQHGGYHRDTPAFVGGVFRRGDLTGLDADAVTNMGARFLTGSISDNDSELEVPAAP